MSSRVGGRFLHGAEPGSIDQMSARNQEKATETWHPTQMLADMLTMRDHMARPLHEISFCYLGDGRNNTANSLLVTGGLLGMDAPDLRPGRVAAVAPGPDDRQGSGRRVRR